MSDLKQLGYGVYLDISQLQKSSEKAQQSFKDLSNTASRQGSSMSSAMAKSSDSIGASLGAMVAKFASVTFAITMLTKAVKGMLTTNMDFERKSSELAAVLGTTKEGVSQLTNAAMDLGRRTEFTATQVEELQIALARLGFSNQQILDMQGSVLKFAQAVNADLGAAANFAGATLRAFGMQSSDTGHLLDVLSAATSKSALDFGKLEASMSTIAPVAHAFGLSLEDTTTLLGALANAGFDASTAATAARNILLNLADANGNLAKGLGHTAKNFDEIISSLKECTERGIDLNTTLEMTDKRSVAAFNALISGADDARKLRDELGDCEGTLNTMSETMTDNLKGAILSLQSAWEGFLLSMQESTGPLAGAVRGLADGINKLTDNAGEFGRLLIEIVATFGIYKAALATVTLLTKGYTVSEIALLARLKATEKAQALLNKTILKNPYVLAAAAVATLAFGIYKLATASTDAEKAMKKLEKTEKEMNKQLASETAQVDVLFARLKAAKKGTQEYDDARKEIMSKYGQYLTKLGDEKTALDDIALAYKTITEAAKEAAKARAMESAVSSAADDYGQKIADIKENLYKELKKKFGNQTGEDGISLAETYYWKLVPVLEGKEELSKETETIIGYFDKLRVAINTQTDEATDYISNSVRQLITSALSQLGIFNAAMAEAERKFGSKPEDDGLIGPPLPPGFKKDGNQGGGGGGNTPLSDEQKKAIARARKELEQLEKDMWMKAADAAVEAMDEGTAKKLASVENDRRQMLDAIDKEQKQLEETAKKAGKKVSQATYDQLNQRRADTETAAANRRKEIELEQAEYIAGLYRDLGDVFASEEQKKIDAVHRTYEEQRKQLDKDLAGGTITQAQHDELSGKIDRAEAKQVQDSWTQMFGNYEQKLEALKTEWANKMKDVPAEFVDEATKQMDAAISDFIINNSEAKSAITRLFDDMTEKSVADLRAIAAEGQELYDFLASGTWDSSLGEKLNISQEQFNTLRRSPEELAKIRKAIKDINDQADDSDTIFKQFSAGLKEIFKAGDNSSKLMKGLDKVTSAVSKATAATGFLDEAFKSIADASGNEAMQSVSDGLSIATDAMGSAMEGAQAGAAFGPWGAAAGAALGLVKSLYENLSKLHDEKIQKRIEDLQEQIDGLGDTYEKLSKLADDAFGNNRVDYINKQNENLRQQNKLIKQQIEEEKTKKKSDDAQIDEWQKKIKENEQLIKDNKEAALDAIFGNDIQSAISDFSDAMIDAWAAGDKGADSAKESVRNMMKQMVSESVKAFMQARGYMDRIRSSMRDAMADEIITKEERERIEQMAQEIADEVEAKYGWTDDLFTQDAEREALKGTGIAASQESVDNLDARMTTMQSHTYTLVQGQAELIRVSNAILDKVAGIERHTEGTERELDVVSRNITTIKNNIDDISLKGVKIRN